MENANVNIKAAQIPREANSIREIFYWNMRKRISVKCYTSTGNERGNVPIKYKSRLEKLSVQEKSFEKVVNLAYDIEKDMIFLLHKM